MYVLSPYLHDIPNGAEIDWIYYSFEVDRVYKEFKFAAFFFAHDYNITEFEHNGQIIQMSAEYLLSKLEDNQGVTIPVKVEHVEILKAIYRDRIRPLFGTYDALGQKVSPGLIEFVEERTNPTGIRNHLLHYAERNGRFIEEEYYVSNQAGDPVRKTRRVGYIPNNPNKFVIIITDHLRKLIREQKFSLKENIDKMIEYQVELRNWCKWIFVDIIHLNRDLGEVSRIKQNPEYLYPTGDDVKDTGNLSEEANLMFTLFNPNDIKYNIKKHFGMELYNRQGGLIHPHYKSLHLVDAREVPAPIHFALNMYGNINLFEKLQIQQLGYGAV